ncbi:hypothetical protein CAI21_21730 [Alkalilimnicola ehrlichii]|uniref:Uncharacterized protein n=1 Tax=Alkalilimnicola ehrlichii TaxID=351052 RepID=A0A3E0WQH0_9GAMM|nr:hypothetical protein [Alkalilimnicola ehrlichii]RFA24397.1 hypothetical protein CAI21_21730 [Alkalilimnicola ehrlichii]RFA35194.1 hypothetical protein CAL65_13915 [Alkalilimnicola ehrlichii]
MLKQLLQRFRRASATTETTPDFKDGRPQAGDIKRFLTGKALFIAPLPVPFGGLAMDIGHNLVEVNEIYLDVDATHHTADLNQAFFGMPFLLGVVIISLFFPSALR